jgi:hypothetical protein
VSDRQHVRFHTGFSATELPVIDIDTAIEHAVRRVVSQMAELGFSPVMFQHPEVEFRPYAENHSYAYLVSLVGYSNHGRLALREPIHV